MSKPIIEYRKCKVCGNKMPIYKHYENKMFCSAKCRATKIKMPYNPYRKGHKPWNKGKKWEALSKARIAEGNPRWKGSKVGYSQLHSWIRKQIIKPTDCQECGAFRKLHLSNISYEYKRDINDWIYLCVPCHIKKDRESGNWGKATKVFGL